MTPREFAETIKRPYSTVALWLRKNQIPGAYQLVAGNITVWQIPVQAVEKFEPPKPGRPKGSKTTKKAMKKAAKK